MQNNKSTNKVIIALLAVLIVVVLCVGGFFIIREINKDNNKGDKGGTSQSSDDKGGSGQSQGGSTGGNSGSTTGGGDSGGSTPTPEPAQDALDAGITYAEVRGNDYYIEVQVNGQVSGRCDISIVPTSGGQGHHGDDDLEIKNKVSICDEDFSLKGMNPGEHKITVLINTYDGRSKTLEQIVNV